MIMSTRTSRSTRGLQPAAPAGGHRVSRLTVSYVLAVYNGRQYLAEAAPVDRQPVSSG